MDSFQDQKFIWNSNQIIYDYQKSMKLSQNIHLQEALSTHFRVVSRNLKQLNLILDNQTSQKNLQKGQNIKNQLIFTNLALDQNNLSNFNFSCLQQSIILRFQLIQSVFQNMKNSFFREFQQLAFVYNKLLFKMPIMTQSYKNSDIKVINFIIKVLKQRKLKENYDPNQVLVDEILSNEDISLIQRLQLVFINENIEQIINNFIKNQLNFYQFYTEQKSNEIIKILLFTFYLIIKGVYENPFQ